MNKIIIIPCGSKKIFDQQSDLKDVKASELYIGTYHKQCKKFALCISDYYCILSAKYGFLFPNDMIKENYNVTFNDRATKPIDIIELKKQIYKFKDFDVIECVCGKKYHEMIEKVFDTKLHNYLQNFKGMGYQMKYMKDHIDNFNNYNN